MGCQHQRLVLIESEWNLKDADSLRGIGAILY